MSGRTTYNYRTPHLVLASGSPRRRDLLIGYYGPEAVRVLPPSSAEEASLEGLRERDAIIDGVAAISRAKADDVAGRLRSGPEADDDWDVVVAADTAVIVSGPGGSRALEKPPGGDDLAPTLRRWFADYYSGRTHEVVTAYRVVGRDGRTAEEAIATTVRFREVSAAEVDHYAASGEPAGKAGGYAIQGLGAAFVTGVEGDLANVVGLPVGSVAGAVVRLVGGISGTGESG